MYSLIFTLAFALAVLISVLVGIHKAKKRNTVNSAARIVVVIVSAIASTFLASWVSWIIGKLLYVPIAKFAKGDFAAILNEMPSLPDALAAIVATVLAPVIFMSLFLTIKAILNKLLIAQLSKLFGKIGKKNAESEEEAATTIKVTALSKICSAVCSFLVLLVVLIPYVGSLKLAGGTGAVLTSTSNKTVSEISYAAANNFGTKTVSFLGGDLIYSHLTTYKINGEKVYVQKESEFITALSSAIISQDSPQVRAVALRGAADLLDDTTIIPTLASELVNAANEDWQSGESFHGIPLPAIGGNTDLSSAFAKCLSNSTCTTMRTDLHTVIDIASIVTERHAVSSLGNPNAIREVLSDEVVTEGIALELLNNERLTPMLGAITDYSFGMIADNLGVFEDSEEAYDSFALKVLEAYQRESAAEAVTISFEERFALYLEDIFSDYGIECDEEARLAVSTAIYQNNPSSPSNIKEFFAQNSIIRFESADDFTQKCSIVTADELVSANEKCDDKNAEAKSFAKICASLSVMLEHVTDSDMDTAVMIRDFGPLLDSFAESKTVGDNVTKKLLTSTMQSKTIRDSLGMTMLDATETARSIADSSDKESYAMLMQSLSNTVRVFEKTSDSSDATEEISTLMKDITPESAKVLQTITTPNVVKNYGVKDKSAEPVSDLVSDIFGNMSDAKNDPDDPMSDEQYEKESIAVNDMMNIAMSASKNSSKSTFGEDSATGITATEYVNRMLNSKIMSKTLVENVYGENDEPATDPLATEKELTEAERTELTDALNNKWENAPEDPEERAEYQKILVSIAAIVNLQISFS